MFTRNKSNTYTIKESSERSSFFIHSSKETHKKIIQFLLEKGEYVKDHHDFTSDSLEINHKALQTLIKDGRDINLRPKKIPSIDPQDIADERKLEKKLKEIGYDLNVRIWVKQDAHGIERYYGEVDNDIYSSENLENLVSLLKGEYLVQSNKPLTSFSTNPLEVFGIVDVALDIFSANKSTIRYNRSDYSRKKKFDPVIEDVEHLKIVIDGADDTANAMNNTGLPQETIALIQALAIFPAFLKGVHLGYEGLGDEAKETHEAYQAADLKFAALSVTLENFRRQLCDICDVPHSSFNHKTPEEFLGQIADKLVEFKDDPEKNEHITHLALNYQKAVEEDIESPSIRDVLVAYCGWKAMTLMMSSVGAYEAQAILNIAGGIEGVSTSSDGNLPLLSHIGNSFGFAGQSLMTVYAFHKAIEEKKEWKEIEEEITEFGKADNISDLSRQIVNKLLTGKRDKHKIQHFGNAALSAGQAMMATGGPIGLALNPLLFTGLGLTLGGVAANSLSELRYQSSYRIDENMDDIEKEIINTPPALTKEDFSNIGNALSKHTHKQVLALEVLGHLRAPQLALYNKYIEKNKDDQGILEQAIAAIGGRKISKWIHNPPQDSVNLVKDNPNIAPHYKNPNDLDIFEVTKKDLDIALQKIEPLLAAGKSHFEAIKKIQEDFISRKSEASKHRVAETSKELCAKIMEKGGASALYLKKKLLRGVANKDLSYDGSLDDDAIDVEKNGKKITATKIDLNKLDSQELDRFLSDKRPQKGSPSHYKKKSVLEKAHQKESYRLKSDHLRPFFNISKLSKFLKSFLAVFKSSEKNSDLDDSQHSEDGLLPEFAVITENGKRKVVDKTNYEKEKSHSKYSDKPGHSPEAKSYSFQNMGRVLSR